MADSVEGPPKCSVDMVPPNFDLSDTDVVPLESIHTYQFPLNTDLTNLAPFDSNPPDIDSSDNDAPEATVPDTDCPDIDVPDPLSQVICTQPGRHGFCVHSFS